MVPREDSFLGEFVPSHNERLKWLTGFSGSAGIALIGQEKGFLFVDGRYTLQAVQETKNITILSLSDFFEKLPEIISISEEVLIDPLLHSCVFIEAIEKKLSKNQIVFQKTPIDELWEDRPLPKLVTIKELDISVVGESRESKLKRVFEQCSSDALFIHDPHEVAWLLNIRGNEIDYTPIALLKAIAFRNGQVEVLVQAHHETTPLNNVRFIKNISASSFREIQVDPEASKGDYLELSNQGKVFQTKSPISLLKAIKNETEIHWMKQAQQRDSEVFKQFIPWLKVQKNIDERTVGEYVDDLRSKQPGFHSLSFPTICGFRENGAIIHYHASEKSNLNITNGVLLIDSGGQYEGGTTDITRTFVMGMPTEEQKKAYTLVLKGNLRLERAIFPMGTKGYQLDILARLDLWEHGLNYPHGTGHGVGAFLSVHEGPQGISPRNNPTELVPGMILSNEPGVYKEGEFGIRIENLLLVKESLIPGFLCFERLTNVPYENDLINFDLLTDIEKKQLT